MKKGITIHTAIILIVYFCIASCKTTKLNSTALAASESNISNSQNLPDSSYYDFWIGEWYQIIDGEMAAEPRFKVKRGMYHSSFEESWVMEGYMAKAWRAWDTRTQKWEFAWIADIGLFQLWEGVKVDGHWYIYKTFMIDGESVLSRQAFIPQNDHTIIRTSEHSRDGGKTWVLRFKETYQKN